MNRSNFPRSFLAVLAATLIVCGHTPTSAAVPNTTLACGAAELPARETDQPPRNVDVDNDGRLDRVVSSDHGVRIAFNGGPEVELGAFPAQGIALRAVKNRPGYFVLDEDVDGVSSRMFQRKGCTVRRVRFDGDDFRFKSWLVEDVRNANDHVIGTQLSTTDLRCVGSRLVLVTYNLPGYSFLEPERQASLRHTEVRLADDRLTTVNVRTTQAPWAEAASQVPGVSCLTERARFPADVGGFNRFSKFIGDTRAILAADKAKAKKVAAAERAEAAKAKKTVPRPCGAKTLPARESDQPPKAVDVDSDGLVDLVVMSDRGVRIAFNGGPEQELPVASNRFRSVTRHPGYFAIDSGGGVVGYSIERSTIYMRRGCTVSSVHEFTSEWEYALARYDLGPGHRRITDLRCLGSRLVLSEMEFSTDDGTASLREREVRLDGPWLTIVETLPDRTVRSPWPAYLEHLRATNSAIDLRTYEASGFSGVSCLGDVR